MDENIFYFLDLDGKDIHIPPKKSIKVSLVNPTYLENLEKDHDLLTRKFNLILSKLSDWAGSVTTVYPEDIRTLLDVLEKME